MESLLRTLFETAVDNPLHGGWRQRHELRNTWRFFVQDGGHRFRGGRFLKRALSREHFVENRAESKNVRAMIGRFSPHLLG